MRHDDIEITENLNNFIPITEIELMIKILPEKTIPNLHDYTNETYQTYKEEISVTNLIQILLKY